MKIAVRLIGTLVLIFAVTGCTSSPLPAPAPIIVPPEKVQAPEFEGLALAKLVTLKSPSPLIEVKLMFRTGSTADPVGKEGLARLTALAILEGSFGSSSNPVTKERISEITEPWGSGAKPFARVSSRTTTFNFTIPRDVLPTYLNTILRPMFFSPLFSETEIERIKSETLSTISSSRFEDLESLGLAATDEFVLEGTRYEHQPHGAESSVPTLTREDVVRFYRDFYRTENLIAGVSSDDPGILVQIRSVVDRMNLQETGPMPRVEIGEITRSEGRRAVVIEEPNAPAASVHFGFPLTINRAHPDFWPLYVANVWLGVHRDSFGRLYQAIREERGYNYGNYTYIEHVTGRPVFLFPPFNTPREQQYFSLWVRPVQHEYAYHLMKATTFELERLVRDGLTEADVKGAKRKAKVLYVNLGETVERLLAAKMDDAFYGMSPGYLEGYLDRIDAVTVDEVNQAMRKHIDTRNIKYVVVTDSAHAAGLIKQLQENRPAFGKGPKEYEMMTTKLPDGTSAWQIPEAKLDLLRLDAAWGHYPLNVREVQLIPVTSIFKTGRLAGK